MKVELILELIMTIQCTVIINHLIQISEFPPSNRCPVQKLFPGQGSQQVLGSKQVLARLA